METLKFTVIKNIEQYYEYCDILENLISKNEDIFEDEIELLTLLIEKWDADNYSLNDSDPVTILKHLMKENNLKSKDLVEILNLSKSTISKILNYHKGLSKETIRKLSDYFKLSQELFNRPYKLNEAYNKIKETA